MMVDGMNPGHAALADWGMTHLDLPAPSHIAELGCGGGRNARELLERYPVAKLTALDYSEVSVEKARKCNRDAIAVGRCRVIRGNVVELPFDDESFDLATAFETVYFWPEPERCFSEVCRALEPGGAFMICNESDGKDKASKRFESIIDSMKCYTADELASMLKNAGFARVRFHHHPKKPWITVIAVK